MRIFVSWSGELSRTIAENLKSWIPCIIQSVEVFYSEDDIEKGENWDNKITRELSECNYAIVCLTADNVTAPWINFEAGAIAKSLDSKVASLMVNVKPSDIKGPLARYQATKLEKQDVLKLLQTINKSSEHPLAERILEDIFSAMWSQFESNVKEAIGAVPNAKTVKAKDDPMEEILQLLRNIASTVSSPEELLPFDYLAHALRYKYSMNEETHELQVRFLDELITWLKTLLFETSGNPDILLEMRVDRLFNILSWYIEKSNSNLSNILLRELKHLRGRFIEINNGVNFETELPVPPSGNVPLAKPLS